MVRATRTDDALGIREGDKIVYHTDRLGVPPMLLRELTDAQGTAILRALSASPAPPPAAPAFPFLARLSAPRTADVA